MSDLISRSALLKKLEEDKKSICSHVYATVPTDCVDDLEFELEYLISIQPTVEVVPIVHAEWITQDDTRTKFMCSQCKSKNHGGHEKYCSNCGAKMKVVE